MPTGMHSPFGVMQQIIKETGWTWHYVLWKISWGNVMMMLADRPGLRKKNAKDGVIKLNAESAAAMRKGLI